MLVFDSKNSLKFFNNAALKLFQKLKQSELSIHSKVFTLLKRDASCNPLEKLDDLDEKFSLGDVIESD